MDGDRRLAFLALREIDAEGSYSNLALNRLFSENRASSQGFVRELVYGVLRNERLLDWKETGIECVIAREKPAHARVIFNITETDE